VNDINTCFDVPHSRWNKVTPEQFKAAGLNTLVESDVGVHLATSSDGIRFVFFQGHQEYDTVSLLKEYKRDLNLYAQGKLPEPPPYPDNYLSSQAMAILGEYRLKLEAAIAQGKPIPQFPEARISGLLDNTWHDTAEAVVGNWLGCIYQITHSDRRVPYMEGIDLHDPLGINNG
jgi:homoserine O-succinyltransferase